MGDILDAMHDRLGATNSSAPLLNFIMDSVHHKIAENLDSGVSLLFIHVQMYNPMT